ncbi:MAG: hypothetical protein ABW019_04835, partial [Chitinophagaceae bacterium]
FLICLSCNNHSIGPLEASYDNWNYESITNATGTVYVKLDSVKIYKHAKVVYSESDATTMLIKTSEGKYVYIQGAAVIELDELSATP